jgi:hypothetical protein
MFSSLLSKLYEKICIFYLKRILGRFLLLTNGKEVNFSGDEERRSFLAFLSAFIFTLGVSFSWGGGGGWEGQEVPLQKLIPPINMSLGR